MTLPIVGDEPEREEVPPDLATRGRDEAGRQIRGSSLLLVGRLIAVLANVVIQVVVVRYLAKTEYGAFAYALSVVGLAESVITLGLDRALPRYLPIYDEHREYDKFFGTLAFVIGTVVMLGIVLTLSVVALQDWLSGRVIRDPLAAALLGLLIALAPIGAMDGMLMSVLAVFANARSIFLRRYVLAPALRIGVVTAFAVGGFGVFFLAAGYVAAAMAGVLLYLVLVVDMFRRRGLLRHLHVRSLRMPVREVVGYTVPLLTSDLVYLLMATTDVLILGHFHGSSAVADLRVIDSAAKANGLVMSSFALLFVPTAARFFARGDRAAVRDLYWRTAVWMAVLTFPVFALTFALAEPVTVTLFEERYRASAVYLAILAFGRYVDAAFGNNGLTLRVFGSMRAIIQVNITAALLNVAINLLLIPPLGALGAALGTCLTLIGFNLLKQLALHRTTGIEIIDRRYVRVYAVIAVAVAALAAAQALFRPGLVASLTLAILASAVVVAVNHDRLDLGHTFPEILRLPLVGRLLARPEVLPPESPPDGPSDA